MNRLKRWIGIVVIIGAPGIVFAQTPPPPQLPPHFPPFAKPKGERQGDPDGRHPRRPHVAGMAGLLEFMADMDITSINEIDMPVLGYGNELLWDTDRIRESAVAIPIPPKSTKRGNGRVSTR
jgi:hypothetical protein